MKKVALFFWFMLIVGLVGEAMAHGPRINPFFPPNPSQIKRFVQQERGGYDRSYGRRHNGYDRRYGEPRHYGGYSYYPYGDPDYSQGRRDDEGRPMRNVRPLAPSNFRGDYYPGDCWPGYYPEPRRRY